MLVAFFLLCPLALGALVAFSFFADRYFQDSAALQRKLAACAGSAGSRASDNRR